MVWLLVGSGFALAIAIALLKDAWPGRSNTAGTVEKILARTAVVCFLLMMVGVAWMLYAA